MEQVYIHFKQSMFEGKRNEFTGGLSGDEKMSQRIHPVEAYIPIPVDSLPPVALAYFDLAKQKGFVGEGSPILYVTANDTTEIKDDGKRVKTYNLVAHWPAFCGLLEKRIENKGLVSLRFDYFTKPTDYETFEALKQSCRIKDLVRNSDYNTCDILKMIKNAPWNAGIALFVKRMAHDSNLPVGFRDAINKGHELFEGMVPNPDRRTPLCEDASIEYIFDSGLIFNKAEAFGNLYPTGMYGGLVTENTFDESKAPVRQPRAWKISNEEDALRAERGIKDYNEVVAAYFNGKVPLQSDLQGRSLEAMVREIIPQVIDAMEEFVQN